VTDLTWLPPLVEYDGEEDWLVYTERIYAFFKRDFIDSRPEFRGRKLGLKAHPLLEGKEATFWHLITEGPEEAKRVPAMDRCARVQWPRAMIAAATTERVLCWGYQRNSDYRIGIALPDFSYVVVLADRKEYLLPWTAFIVREKRRARYKAEYEAGPL
jgi:hypothetical protein